MPQALRAVPELLGNDRINGFIRAATYAIESSSKDGLARALLCVLQKDTDKALRTNSWLPLGNSALSASGIHPEDTSGKGIPFCYVLKRGGWLSDDTEIYNQGIGQFVIGVSGRVHIIFWTFAQCLLEGWSVRAALTNLANFSPKLGAEWLSSHATVATVEKGEVLWVPYGHWITLVSDY